MLLVTFHGGKPQDHPLRNNVHAYDTDGKLASPAVLDDPEGVVLNELRGIRMERNYLYVVVANKTQNSVLCYEGSGTNYRFVSTFATQQTTNGILHPFDVIFDDAGYCYLSSQDTNLVTRFKVTAGGKVGTPAPIPAALPAHGTFLPGTFIASAIGTLSKPATTPVPSPAGLEYSNVGDKKHSVRGILWTNNTLYVADQPSGRIKAFDRDGRFLGQSNVVETPIHLLANQKTLYVTGANQILRASLTADPGKLNLQAVPGVVVKNAGCMAFTQSGHIYIASRTENTIYKFDLDFKPMAFSCHLPDNPEFLIHV